MPYGYIERESEIYDAYYSEQHARIYLMHHARQQILPSITRNTAVHLRLFIDGRRRRRRTSASCFSLVWARFQDVF